MTSGLSNTDSAVPCQLDHLVYATPDLQATVAGLEARLGVRFAAGGARPTWQTRKALHPLGSRS